MSDADRDQQRLTRFLLTVRDEEGGVGVVLYCDELGFCTAHIYSLSYLLAFLRIRGFDVSIEVLER